MGKRNTHLNHHHRPGIRDFVEDEERRRKMEKEEEKKRRGGSSGGQRMITTNSLSINSRYLDSQAPREPSSHSAWQQERICVIKGLSTGKSASAWTNDSAWMAAGRPISERFPQIEAVSRGSTWLSAALDGLISLDLAWDWVESVRDAVVSLQQRVICLSDGSRLCDSIRLCALRITPSSSVFRQKHQLKSLTASRQNTVKQCYVDNVIPGNGCKVLRGSTDIREWPWWLVS